jgi:hypothetical protein
MLRGGIDGLNLGRGFRSQVLIRCRKVQGLLLSIGSADRVLGSSRLNLDIICHHLEILFGMQSLLELDVC